MSAPIEPLSRRSREIAAPVFVGVAFGLSGLYWLLFALHARGWLPFDPSSDLLGAARGYTPALAAVVTALALSGREGYFYDNPIDRYSLNSYMLRRGKLHTGDGKLVIYVQHDERTDPKQRQNWLPAPKDGSRFTARFYGPSTSLIDGSYDMPGVVRVD